MRSPAKSTFEAILLLGVAVACFAAPLAAESCEKRGPGPMAFSAFDLDSDGAVSEDEFNTVRAEHVAAMKEAGRMAKGMENAPSFTDFDADGDGALNPEELAAGQQAHMGKRHDGAEGCKHSKKCHHMQKGDGKHGRAPVVFADVDTNGDGCISQQEFDAHHAGHHGGS